MFELPHRYLEEIIAHAREEAPNECCGIIAGKDGHSLKLYRARNSEQSPFRYNIDPADLYRIHSEVEALGWEFLAIYHSHPQSEAYPSATDVIMAATTGAGEPVELWPGAVYLIISLLDRASPKVRAFRIEGGAVTEEALSLLDR